MPLTIRTIERHERDAVLDLLKEWYDDRAFFQRYFDLDPAFRDDLCLVAIDDGRVVSTLQIFPKTIRVGAATLRVGGIGNVFTTDACRGRGIASDVLRAAIALMEADGFDLSLLFATRLAFYGQFGWGSHRRLLGAVQLSADVPPPQHAIRPFERERDLDAVMAIYDRYNAARSGSVVRDRTYWEGQLRYAGNPDETFLVAEQRGRVVAYARLADLYSMQTVMEHGAAEGARAALVDVLLALAAHARDSGFMVLHLGAEPELAAELAAFGLAAQEVEDVFSMWRVIAPQAVAAKLGLAVDAVQQPDFFDRVLPYSGSVYWTSDRF